VIRHEGKNLHVASKIGQLYQNVSEKLQKFAMLEHQPAFEPDSSGKRN